MLTSIPASSRAEEAIEREPSLTIRVYDYAGIPAKPLKRAVDIVSGAYNKIGVRVDWLGALNRSNPTELQQAPTDAVATATIVILTPKMARLGRIPKQLIGYAAVPDKGIGRIAFVVYDRVQQIAREAVADETELLGVVMAHEVGHLLLPPGSHTDDGLMRGRWDRDAFRHLNPERLGFSGGQASRIRKALGTHERQKNR